MKPWQWWVGQNWLSTYCVLCVPGPARPEWECPCSGAWACQDGIPHLPSWWETTPMCWGPRGSFWESWLLPSVMSLLRLVWCLCRQSVVWSTACSGRGLQTESSTTSNSGDGSKLLHTLTSWLPFCWERPETGDLTWVPGHWLGAPTWPICKHPFCTVPPPPTPQACPPQGSLSSVKPGPGRGAFLGAVASEGKS